MGEQILQVIIRNAPTEGPIIVAAYTNHALDQFLCGLLRKGIRNLVRMGSR